MRPGDEVIVRESNEPALVLAVVDAAGTLLVRCAGEEFQLPREALMTLAERHASCGCC